MAIASSKLAWTLGCVLALAHAATPAHDLSAIATMAMAEGKVRKGFLPGDHVTPSDRHLMGTIGMEWVVPVAYKWRPGQRLQVCFYGGAPELRQRIASIASQWTSYGNIKMDFDLPNGRDCGKTRIDEIRVAFSDPEIAGHWSYVGTESMDPRLAAYSSMSLEFFDTRPPEEPDFSRIVLHEFGHALGLEHEHQSPAAKCNEEFDWPRAEAYFARQGWTPKKVRDALEGFVASGAYEWSDVDRLSIMHYALPRELFREDITPQCYVETNDVVSEVDKRGFSRLYSSNARGALMARGKMLEATQYVKGLSPEFSRRVAQSKADIRQALSKE